MTPDINGVVQTGSGEMTSDVVQNRGSGSVQDMVLESFTLIPYFWVELRVGRT